MCRRSAALQLILLVVVWLAGRVEGLCTSSTCGTCVSSTSIVGTACYYCTASSSCTSVQTSCTSGYITKCPTPAPPPPPATPVPPTSAPSTSRPSTAAPSTALPSTAAPSTASPSTAVPSTAVPQTAPPSTATPSTVVPSTAVPSTAGPSTVVPSTAAPSSAAPSTAGPSTATPSTATPSSAAPSTAGPSTATPSTAAPSSAVPSTIPLTIPTVPSTVTAAPSTAIPVRTTAGPAHCIDTISGALAIVDGSNKNLSSLAWVPQQPSNGTKASATSEVFIWAAQPVSYEGFSSAGSYSVALAFGPFLSLASFNSTLMPSALVTAIGSTLSTPIDGNVAPLNATSVVFTFFFDQKALSQTSSTVSSLVLLPAAFTSPQSCSQQISLGVQLTVLKKAESSAVATARATQAIGSVVSVVTMSPTSAVQMARLGALQDISACIVDTDGETPIGFAGGSFTSMAVGTTPGLYLRGGVIGNILIVLVGTCILGAVMAVWSALEAAKRSVAKHVATPSILLNDALQMGRIPSVYYPVFLVMAPSTVGFGITLLFLSPVQAGNIALGVATCVIFTLYAALVTNNLRTNFSCHLEATKTPPRQNIITWLCHPDRHWVSDSVSVAGWRRRNRLYFDDYDCWWYCLVDLWSSIIIGVVNGVTISSREVCAAQIGIILMVFLVVFVLGLWVNPTVSRSLRYYINVTNFIGLVSCCCLVGAVRTDNALLLNVSNWLMMLVSVVSILKLFVDISYVFYRYLRSLASDKAYVTTDTSHMNLAKTFNPAEGLEELRSADSDRHSHNNEMMDLILDDMMATIETEAAPRKVVDDDLTTRLLAKGEVSMHGMMYEIVPLEVEDSGGEQVTVAKQASPPVAQPVPARVKQALNWDPFDDSVDDDPRHGAPCTRTAAAETKPLILQEVVSDSDDDWAKEL